MEEELRSLTAEGETSSNPDESERVHAVLTLKCLLRAKLRTRGSNHTQLGSHILNIFPILFFLFSPDLSYSKHKTTSDWSASFHLQFKASQPDFPHHLCVRGWCTLSCRHASASMSPRQRPWHLLWSMLTEWAVTFVPLTPGDERGTTDAQWALCSDHE